MRAFANHDVTLLLEFQNLIRSLPHPVGTTAKNVPTPIKNYLKNLRSRMSNPFRLRIGGNSLDGSFYNSSAKQMITFDLTSAAAGVENSPVTYGPQVLSQLNVCIRHRLVQSRLRLAVDVWFEFPLCVPQQLANDIGGISHLLTLSLMHPSNASDVVSFAAAAQNALGSNLDAFLVGNVRLSSYCLRGSTRRTILIGHLSYRAPARNQICMCRTTNAVAIMGSQIT